MAREIACGANGAVWCLSASDYAPGGASIHIWNEFDWEHVDGAAVKIGIATDGTAWIVNSAGQIFRRSGEGWELMPGLASEIACGNSGFVCCLSASASPIGEHSIHAWNGADWDHISGNAVKIAAGTADQLLITDSLYRIYRAHAAAAV
ncbi:MAG: hypothetical protein JSS02_07655 [Planctomycetes bacterium]|nr:hypothetical protein [Planctomycetota bacterium]